MNILSVILIIGILIFVHELGHFLSAKALKIPVKIFSIGFPLGNMKPLFSFKWGETDYQLNPLPLGGFCAFMDDDKSIEKVENDQRLLNNRKVWERAIVISGGVIGNFIFAIFVAIVMYFSLGIPEGREFSDGVVVLDVKGGSPADKAGLQSFDTIVEVDKTPLKFESDMKAIFDKTLKVDNDKKTADIGYISAEGDKLNKDFKIQEDGTLGITTEEVRGIFVTNVMEGKVGEKAGIQKNDILLSIAGKDFKGARNPEGQMRETLKAQGDKAEVSLQVLRKGEIKELKAVLDNDKKLGVGIEFIKGLLVKESKSDSVPVNALILEVNKNALYDTSSIMRNLIAKHKDGTEAEVVIKRGGEEKTFNIVPEKEGVIGVQIQAAAKEVRRAPTSFIEPVSNAAMFIGSTTWLLSEALLRMFTGHISASELGGPIMVVAKGAEIAQADFSKLFQFTIMISIELVILNIIPLPAVDGGHLFLLMIEKIRGRRLPREFEERIHYTGLIVLLGFGVFLIFKDVLTLSKIIR